MRLELATPPKRGEDQEGRCYTARCRHGPRTKDRLALRYVLVLGEDVDVVVSTQYADDNQTGRPPDGTHTQPGCVGGWVCGGQGGGSSLDWIFVAGIRVSPLARGERSEEGPAGADGLARGRPWRPRQPGGGEVLRDRLGQVTVGWEICSHGDG